MYYLFFASALLTAIFFIYWFILPGKLRSIFLLVLSFIFIATYNVVYAVYVLAVVLSVYFCALYLENKKNSRKAVIKTIIGWLLLNLCLFKYAHILFNFIPILQHNNFVLSSGKILFPLGLSYLIFRLLHYIVEVYKKNMAVGVFQDVALYALFFPTFLAGPVERFPRFYPQIIGIKKITLREFNYAVYRICIGLIKKCIIADTLVMYITPVLNSPYTHSKLLTICAIYGLSFRIYMDFSGYTDMAIGIARLFGYTIMENFDRPFLQKNIAFFWRSWHISVYSWIRDYFFFPLFGWRPSHKKTYVGIVCTMVVFMLWHEGSLNLLLLGLYHGLGLAAWYSFQEIKAKHKKIKSFFSKKYLDPFSIIATFSFVSAGFVLFFYSLPHSVIIFNRLF